VQEKTTMPLSKFVSLLDNWEQEAILLEVAFEDGKLIVPSELLGMYSSRDGKFFSNAGLGVYPKGSLGFGTCNLAASLGAGASIPLGNFTGFSAVGTHYQWLLKYITVNHNDTGNNRKLTMRWGNATMGVDLITSDGATTIAPNVRTPIFPRIKDSAGAYIDTFPGSFGPVIVDAENWLTIHLTDLADTKVMTLEAAFTSIVHD